ncbi:MAG: homoserine dehydrogenase [Candidatus Brocadiia bacterium]
MPKTKVALYGCGTIGTGVARILLGEKGGLLRKMTSPIELAYVVDVRAEEIAQEIDFPASVEVTTELDAPLGDPDVGIVVELIGGTDIAARVVEKALRSGKDIVTANKALLAAHGQHLYALAREVGKSIAFEASVAGGIPVVASMRDAMIGDRIQSVYGIVNGTCNYILTQMTDRGVSYGEALLEAQEKGYAEANPELDVEGHDSAHKLGVLARIGFGVEVQDNEIPREGVTNIEPQDLRYARALGYTVKLLAIGIQREEGTELRVHPALLKHNHPLATIGGAYNAVCVHGACAGEIMLTGLGAGRWPTATAVVADVARLALGTYQPCFRDFSQFGDVPEARMIPSNELEMRYYFRLSCHDRPGVLAKVAGILGEHDISIASCMQQDQASHPEHYVPVVFMTHQAKESEMNAALSKINALDSVDGADTRMLRVQDI